MFPGQCPIELQYQIKDIGKTLFCPFLLAGIIRVDKQIDMNIAIAGMAKIDNCYILLFCE